MAELTTESFPTVSVITPTYNHGHFIASTIESLQAQTYSRWELIVVDDGSTDDTEHVVIRYAEQDPRISYVPQHHRGVGAIAATLNVGLAASRGELVTMLGSDDLWPAHRLAVQVPLFVEEEVVLVFGRGRLIGPNDEDLGEVPLPAHVDPVMNRPVGSVLGSLLQTNWLPQYTVLIRRRALEQIGGYLQPKGLLAEDYPTHLALALQGEFRFVDSVLGFYRQHPHQQTRLHALEMVATDNAMVLDFYRQLPVDVQSVAGISEAVLVKALRTKYHNSFFYEGRRKLLNGERREASRLFLKGLSRGGVETKVKSMAGLGCALLGLDLERVARLAGRPRLR